MSEQTDVSIYCAHTELVDTDKLVENPRNPNQHPDSQIALLAKIIRAQGFRNAIVVSKRSGFITKGHGRFAAARLLEMEKVPVDYQEYESEAAEWADMIADNKIAELSETDDEELKSLLGELEGQIDMDLTGFDETSLDEILDRLSEDEPLSENEEEIPELPESAITQPGDLYELGKHRLLCGDSTNPEHVKLLMNGERAVLFATDPPYLVDYDGSNRPTNKDKRGGGKDWSDSYGCTWDEADAEGNNDLYDRFIKVACENALEKSIAIYMWHASKRQKMVEEAWEKNGLLFHQQIIWVKPKGLIARTWYLWRHEPCLFGWIQGNKAPRTSDEHPNTVWEIEGLSGDERPDHPTPKPLECFAIPMRQHTKRDELCYEPFSGSGSQLIAGEKLGRRVYGLEISPAYCDVIVKRWLALGEGRRVICNGEDVTEQFADVTDSANPVSQS